MASRTCSYRAHLYTVLVLLVSLSASSLAFAGIDVLVTEGEASPDGNGQFSILGEPVINDRGHFGFVAELSGTNGAPNDLAGFFRGGPNGLVKIARMNDSFANSTVTGFLPPIYLDQSGSMTGFAGLVSGGGQYFTGDGNGLLPLALPGSPSPSGNNSLLNVAGVVVNDSGTLLYRGYYENTVNGTTENGVYQRAPDGTVTTLFLKGDSAPGGGVFGDFGSLPQLNESGQMVTAWDLNVNGQLYESLIRIDGSTMTELVRAGDTIDDGVTQLETIGSPLINENGDIAFSSNLPQPGEPTQTGVLLAKNGSVTLVASGVLPGATSYLTVARPIGLSDDGTVAFHAEFNSIFHPNGIYVANDGGPTLVAIEDAQTPSASHFFRRFYPSQMAVNDASELAFVADLSDTSGGGKTGRGLYLHDSDNGLQEIIRSGDELGGGTISEVYFMGSVPNFTGLGGDNSLSGLNEAGQVAFAFELTNGGGGIALWTPESQLTCDFDADGDCDQDDIDALYASGDIEVNEILEWLDAASSTENLSNPNGLALHMGDLDLDGNVDSTDLGGLLNNFGSTGSLPWRFGNLDDDATIGSADLGLLLNGFGAGAASTTNATSATNVVPEPNDCYLIIPVFVISALAVRGKRRRRLVVGGPEDSRSIRRAQA